MQLTEAQKQVFEQLGRNPDFRAWLHAEEATQIKVLKVHPVGDQLYKAQGRVALIDQIKVHCGLS